MGLGQCDCDIAPRRRMHFSTPLPRHRVEDSQTTDVAAPTVPFSITSNGVYAERAFRIRVAGGPIFPTHLLSDRSAVLATA